MTNTSLPTAQKDALSPADTRKDPDTRSYLTREAIASGGTVSGANPHPNRARRTYGVVARRLRWIRRVP